MRDCKSDSWKELCVDVKYMSVSVRFIYVPYRTLGFRLHQCFCIVITANTDRLSVWTFPSNTGTHILQTTNRFSVLSASSAFRKKTYVCIKPKTKQQLTQSSNNSISPFSDSGFIMCFLSAQSVLQNNIKWREVWKSMAILHFLNDRLYIKGV